ncbi:proteasomal ATPase-associated factor 1-like [Portunus trituberculatus]|uniref:proteasomal ATPase-associated factor 1-like n=1 Tax=Portunus trituberculatus TaxID=210409 RepID=UPI001E1CDF5E|nr:proteasomal ATPase-associated factor 1-like [Portunus trituberculatus]
MAVRGGLLVLQSDWQESLRDNDTSAWVMYKALERQAEHGKVGGTKPSGPFTLQGRTERTITITHTPTGLSTLFVAPTQTFNHIHAKSVMSLDVADGGLAVSVCAENKLLVWETETGLVRRSLEGHLFDAYSCRLFPSGVVVLSGSGDMQLRIWDAVTGQCPVVLKGHTGAVLDTAIVERGKNVISVSKDGSAKLWNCGAAACVATLLTTESVLNCCAITDVTGSIDLPPPAEPPGELEHDTAGKVLLAGADDGQVHLVNVAGRAVLAVLPLGSPVLAGCWATTTLAVLGLADGRLEVVDAQSLNSRPLCHDSASSVESIVPHAGGVLAGRRDGTCQFYKLDGSSSLQLTGSDCDPIYRMAINSSHVYTACRDGHVRKYCVRDLGAV